jgi:hypothetical protein
LFWLAGGEAVMNFAFACAGLLGLVTWLIYTVRWQQRSTLVPRAFRFDADVVCMRSQGYGFASFPVGFMKGSKDVSEEAGEVDADLVVTQERRRVRSSSLSLSALILVRR